MKEVIPVIREAGYDDLADKLDSCGLFINVIRCINCNTRHFAGYFRCKSRFCLPCSHIKSMLYISRIVERLKQLEGYRLYFLTLTLRDRETLKGMIEELRDAWKKLTNTNKESRKKFKERFQGYIKSIEIKRGKNSGRWHVHYHVLLYQYNYVNFEKDYEWIKRIWKDITKGEGSVFIREARGEILDICLELIKYILKPGNYKVEDYNEIIPAISGLRQISTGGVFRFLNKEVEDDMNRIEEKNIDNFICQRCGFNKGELETIKYELVKDIILYDLVDNQQEKG